MRKTTIIIFSLILFYFISCTAFIGSVNSDAPPKGNVAVIPVRGVISLGGSGLKDFDYDFVIDSIKEAENRDDIKAIVLDINSPGGAPVASEEIGRLIKESSKPTVAWIREIGTSAAYWIASGADHVVANRMSITGSIGVIGSYLEFSDFLERYNITYQRVVSGEHKDIGSPFKKLSSSDKELLQDKINKIHDFFVKEVAENRRLEEEKVKELATGIIYLGSEALSLGLVDELGGEQEVKAYLEKKLGEKVIFANYEDDKGILDVLSSVKAINPLEMQQGISLR